MKYSKNDIEYLLLNKSYDELNANEVSLISAEINNKKEYEELQQLLINITSNSDKTELIKPNPLIKTLLMDEFKNKHKSNKIWLNSFVATLFPKDKKIMAMPGFQLSGIAASLAILFTIFINYDLNSENSELANNELTTITISDSSKSKDQTLNENKIGTNDSSSPISSTLADEKLHVSEAEIIELEEEPTEANEIAILSELSSSEIAIAQEMENTSELMDVGLSFEDEIFESDGIRENALIISGSTEPVSALRAKRTAAKEMENNAITVCRSLKDDQELIALFFTAL